jgi:hypothetical protein
LLIPTLVVAAPTSSYAASYNPAPANKFHVPISSTGLVENAIPNALNIVQNVQPLSGSTSRKTSDPTTFPQNSLRFTNDQSYMPMSETTIAFDPNNPSHVIGGFNDARWLFCSLLTSAACPSGFAISLSGFTASIDGGRTIFKSNDLPGLLVTEKNLTSGKKVKRFLLSWGDPSITAASNGDFVYSSLAIDPISGANGIMIADSNANLWNPNVVCITLPTTPWVNPC